MTTTTTKKPHGKPEEETNVVDTIQSLIVAFALAMSVRSFVTEGFVIPTGSMAPTLMGQHMRLTSPATGFSYPADAGPAMEAARQLGRNYRNFGRALSDPMLSVDHPLAQIGNDDIMNQSSMGDRVLVLKYLYAFQDPQRWDVVVFKNPTDPNGDAANYIKRLVGLPSEQLLILDGDVFTAPLGADRSKLRSSASLSMFSARFGRRSMTRTLRPLTSRPSAKRGGGRGRACRGKPAASTLAPRATPARGVMRATVPPACSGAGM